MKAGKIGIGKWLKNRQVVLDGTNICYWGGEGAGRMSLATVLSICADLHRRNVDYKVYFDASTFYHLREKGRIGDADLYQRLLTVRPDRFVEVASGQQADYSILSVAAVNEIGKKPRAVISNDRYRDYLGQFEFLKRKNRLLSGKPCKGGLVFSDVNWFVRLEKAA